jgi:hypothetical protein
MTGGVAQSEFKPKHSKKKKKKKKSELAGNQKPLAWAPHEEYTGEQKPPADTQSQAWDSVAPLGLCRLPEPALDLLT